MKNTLTNDEYRDMRFIGTQEVATVMGCSVPTARQIMHSEGFPAIKVGNRLCVMVSSFKEWAASQQVM